MVSSRPSIGSKSKPTLPCLSWCRWLVLAALLTNLVLHNPGVWQDHGISKVQCMCVDDKLFCSEAKKLEDCHCVNGVVKCRQRQKNPKPKVSAGSAVAVKEKKVVIRRKEVKEAKPKRRVGIDFVVAGFQKCGTTYLERDVLCQSDSVYIPWNEIGLLNQNKPDEFMDVFEDANRLKRNRTKPLSIGYKSPMQLASTKSLTHLTNLYPDIRMVLSMRHPVEQFESYYNYVLRNAASTDNILPVEEIVNVCHEMCPSNSPRNCLKNWAGKICTGNSNWHMYISRMGITPMNTPEELDLLGNHVMSIHKFPGWQKVLASKGGARTSPRLFLIENSQMDYVSNMNVTVDLFSDLERFLQIDEGALPRPQLERGDAVYPKYDYKDRAHLVLKICDDKNIAVRQSLMEIARNSSKWIMDYLLHPSNRELVVVSNFEDFKDRLDTWNHDPCDEKLK